MHSCAVGHSGEESRAFPGSVEGDVAIVDFLLAAVGAGAVLIIVSLGGKVSVAGYGNLALAAAYSAGITPLCAGHGYCTFHHLSVRQFLGHCLRHQNGFANGAVAAFGQAGGLAGGGNGSIDHLGVRQFFGYRLRHKNGVADGAVAAFGQAVSLAGGCHGGIDCHGVRKHFGNCLSHKNGVTNGAVAAFGQAGKRYHQLLSSGGIIHLKTDSPFLYTYTDAMVKENNYPIVVNTNNLYEAEATPNIEDARRLQTHYEKQWLDRGMTIKYIAWKLPERPSMIEPDIEIEKDTYRSYGRNYVSSTNH